MNVVSGLAVGPSCGAISVGLLKLKREDVDDVSDVVDVTRLRRAQSAPLKKAKSEERQAGKQNVEVMT